MNLKQIKTLETPYAGVSDQEYQVEKRRLQVELLNIQQRLIKDRQRLAVVFEGRDAAGKGSTIKRFVENLMPTHVEVTALGVPNQSESKFWFKRYEQHFPKVGHIGFFDRSWYSRALIEPTMSYCSESRYKRFMRKVLPWEHQHINSGLLLVKFYLSIDKEAQLYRFEDRLNSPLTYWKFSENDLHARKKWSVFTRFKRQMFQHTSSDLSPWVVGDANSKKEARLTCLLYLVRAFGHDGFEPLNGEAVGLDNSSPDGSAKFDGLTCQQLAGLKELRAQEAQLANADD